MDERKIADKNSLFIIVAVVVIIAAIIGAIIIMVKTMDTSKSDLNTPQTPVGNNPTSTIAASSTPIAENSLDLTDRTVIMETNFGTLHIDVLDKAAPKASENFIRLSNNKYYDGIKFHRMVESPDFKIIQGGDPKGNGTGGESVFGSGFETEVFKKGTKEFVDAALYPNFNGNTATYKKGYIAMAHSSLPNSNGSQFFLMLGDTILPADYTIFAKVRESDFSVLDKISNDVDPVGGEDGKPSKEIVIVKASLE
jgi:peptidyl-prolyl cis-trans isomerase B (cyclophilin B)